MPNPRRRSSGIVPNGPKVREAILYIIGYADRRGQKLTQFEILKSVFIADRSHLNRYGRPITFDHYVAMKDGPVPSLAYNVLKEEGAALKEAGIRSALWKTEPFKEGKKHFSAAVRTASEELLSESDIDELESAVRNVLALGVTRTWDLVHQDAAYKAAWGSRRDDTVKRVDMDYALLFDKPNPQQANEVKFISEHV